MIKLTSFFLLLLTLGACRQPNIVGDWKIVTKLHFKDIDSSFSIKANTGDLTLLRDSTYLIKGWGSNESKIPGWHVGGDETGSWKGSNKERLILYPDYYRSLIPDSWKTFGRTTFKIIQLDHSELILASLDSTRGMHIDSLIKYRR